MFVYNIVMKRTTLAFLPIFSHLMYQIDQPFIATRWENILDMWVIFLKIFSIPSTSPAAKRGQIICMEAKLENFKGKPIETYKKNKKANKRIR